MANSNQITTATVNNNNDVKLQWLNNPSHASFTFQTEKINKEGEKQPKKKLEVLSKMELNKKEKSLEFPFLIVNNKKEYEEVGRIKITHDFKLSFNIVAMPLFKNDTYLKDFPEITNFEQLVIHILRNELTNKTYFYKSHIQDYRLIILSEFILHLDDNQDLFSFDGYEQVQESLDDTSKATIIENAYLSTCDKLGSNLGEKTMVNILYNAHCKEIEAKTA